jgi:hypothetical protein
LDDLFKWAKDEKKLPSFYLYVTGYAHFFNENTDDCDKWSFSAFPRFADDMPLLTKPLRKEINGLAEQFMTVYVRTIPMPPSDPLNILEPVCAVSYRDILSDSILFKCIINMLETVDRHKSI